MTWRRGPLFLLAAFCIAVVIASLSLVLPARGHDFAILAALAFWVGASAYYAWVNPNTAERRWTLSVGGVLLVAFVAWQMWPLTEPY